MSDAADTALDMAELDAARAARRARETEQTPAQRLVRLDALIRELAALKGATRRR